MFLEGIQITFCEICDAQVFWRQAAVGRCGCYFFEISSGSTCFSLSRSVSLQVKHITDFRDCHSADQRVYDGILWLIGLAPRSKSEHLPRCPPLYIEVLVLLQPWLPWFPFPAAFATPVSLTPRGISSGVSLLVSQKTPCSSPPAQ